MLKFNMARGNGTVRLLRSSRSFHLLFVLFSAAEDDKVYVPAELKAWEAWVPHGIDWIFCRNDS
jgi:hypothetical protein